MFRKHVGHRVLSATKPRPFATRTDLEERFGPILRLLGYFGPESTRARIAQGIFRSCAVQAGAPVWSKRGLVRAAEFRPNHALLLTHVWMVHRRLHDFPRDRKSEATQLQELIFDELWDDTTKRIRQAGIQEISVDRNLADVQKYSFAAAVEYDQAIAHKRQDAAKTTDDLAAALWRHVFLATEEPAVTVDHCLALSAYVLAQLDMLDALHPDDLLQANFDWVHPKFPSR